MKITAFLLLALCMQVSATTLAQNVTLSEHNAPLEKVIGDIKQQTGYSFFYNQDWLKQAQPVDIDVKNASLDKALQLCFANQPYDYAIVNKTIVLKLKERPAAIPNTPAPAVTVSGKVANELGEPMAGVTVKQKNNTTNGTVTNAKGDYSINVPDDKTVIVFSYIGYETQELTAKDIPSGSVITLKAAENNLKEVVISKGYYDEKQALSTGDISIVSSRTIDEQPVSDPIQALIGRVPGLDIQQTSGIPGAYATVRIRGLNSIANGTNPLYLIDGVPFSSQSLTSSSISGGALGGSSTNPHATGGGESPFDALNPDDIESIEILKDADATAIYGSRGANGVILITTKKGKAGDTKVDLNISQGIGQVGHFMDLLNTQQYLAMRHEAFANDGLAFPSIATTPTDNNYDINGVWDTTRYTNWQKALIGNTAQYSNIQADVSGGTANTQFLVSTGYNRQTTVYPGDFDDWKASMHFSLNHSSSNQKFHMQLSAGYVNDSNHIPQVNFASNILLAPDAPAIYNSNGGLNWQNYNGTATWTNPLAQGLRTADAVTNNLQSSMTLNYELLPGLKIGSNLGYSHDEMNQTILTPASSFAPPNNNLSSRRSASFATAAVQTWIIEPQLTYTRQISHGHLDLLIGSTFQQSTTSAVAERTSGYSSDQILSDPAAATTVSIANDMNTLYRYNSLYGRIGYSWEDKYLLNITARRDGSSRFGPDKQFGNFGAVGAGWIFSKETSVNDNLPFLSFGKLRVSYGITGNDQTGDYQFLSTYTPSSTTYQGTAGLSPTLIANPNFGWEQVKKLDVGVEFGFLKDRIYFISDYYRNRTDNQIVGYPLPFISGFVSVAGYNLPAIVQNSGWEFTLNTMNIKGQNFTWTSSATFTLPENKLISFPGLAGSNYANSYIVGQSLFIQERYDFTGVDPKTGLYTFATKNSNGIPSSPQDLVPTVPLTQKFYGGLQNTFNYKRFQLDFFIQFVKQTGYNYLNYGSEPGTGFNQPTVVLNRWQTPGDVTSTGKFSTIYGADPNYLLSSSNAVIGDASFIRLKNASLSYSLPKTWLQSVHIRNGRIFLQGQNLLTLTHYIGLDPETQGLALPPLRMITTGVNAAF